MRPNRKLPFRVVFIRSSEAITGENVKVILAGAVLIFSGDTTPTADEIYLDRPICSPSFFLRDFSNKTPATTWRSVSRGQMWRVTFLEHSHRASEKIVTRGGVTGGPMRVLFVRFSTSSSSSLLWWAFTYFLIYLNWVVVFDNNISVRFIYFWFTCWF